MKKKATILLREQIKEEESEKESRETPKRTIT